MLTFLRRVYCEFHGISWSNRQQTLAMTFVVILGVVFSAGVFLSIDYVVFKFLKIVYGLRF